MTDPSPHEEDVPLDQDPIRPHVFDGDIREYDKRLPNWWLFTFYSAVVFAFGYWIWAHEFSLMPTPEKALAAQMAENARLAALNSGSVDDANLWEWSHDGAMIARGQATFTATCASCHMTDLAGGIGPNLKDQQWIHGGAPLEILGTVSKGVLEKGMPAWGPILGQEKITEVTAYILSFHHRGEPVEKVPGWTPKLPGAPVASQ